MKTKLVVGLGNFPKEYENTKHNIGFQAIDSFCNAKKINLDHEKFSGLFARLKIDDSTSIIAKPKTYMNLSGEFVKQVCDFYKIDSQDVLIIYDDIDTELGKIRIKTTGSSGGQNGIKNIIEKLNTQDLKRVRIGIGKPTNKNIDLADYVLSKISTHEKEIFSSIFAKITDIIYDFITDVSFEKIINKYN